MATKTICDICKLNEADDSYKFKRSEKYCSFWWGRYEVIDICEECANKLFDISSKIHQKKINEEELAKLRKIDKLLR